MIMKTFLHKSLLKTMLLLCALIVGSGSAWATDVETTSFSTTSGNVGDDTNVTYTTYRGGGTSNPYLANNTIRLYQNQSSATGGYVVIGVPENYVITSATIRSTSATTTGYKLVDTDPESTTPAKNTFDVSDKSLSANSDYTVSNISTRYIVFACFGTTSGTRLHLSKISITYQSSGGDTYTVTYDANGGTGTMTDNNSYEEGDVVTLLSNTFTAPSGKTWSSWAVTDESSQSVTVTNGTFTMPASNVTVTAQWADLPCYTVTLSDDAQNPMEEYSPGVGVTLPSRSAIGSYAFAGWSATNVSSKTTEAPTIIEAGTYYPTANITLYPVYRKTVAGGGTTTEWHLTTLANADEGVYALLTDDGHAFTGSISSGHGGVTSGENSAFVFNSNNVATTVPSGVCEITFTAVVQNEVTVGYTMYNSSYGYLYASKASSGGLAWHNSEDSYWYFAQLSSVDNWEYSKSYSGNKARLRPYNNSSFRTYNSNTGDVLKLAKKVTVPNTTTYYWSAPVVAAVETPEITVDENFYISTTATISCATEGATIYYSYDNSTWNEYTGELTITATTTIYAKAQKGEDWSSVASTTTTKQLATPTVTITPAQGFTNDLANGTNVAAGTLTATVTYNDAAVAGASVTWESNNTSVATVNATTGAVTLIAKGTAKITASYAGNSDYAAASAEYDLTVINSYDKGQRNNPYTVAEANEATPASGKSDVVYIQGIVSGFVASSIVDDGSNYRYYISDDGTTSDQLLVYKGKGLNNVAFSDANDLQINDVVVITGQLTTYQNAPEVASGNYIVSLTRKTASDLAITSSSPVELSITSENMSPTSTITWTTSSTGTMSFESGNTSVATVSAAGVITAVGEGSTTITISQAADESYQASSNLEVTVNVTDNRSAVVTGIDLPTAQKTLAVGALSNFAATATVNAGFTGSVTYTYATSDATVVEVDGSTYSAAAPGTATITITATPIGGNAANYKPASQEVVVTVKGTTTLTLSSDGDIEYYGTPITFTATVAEGYDGTLAVSSDKEIIATASIEGNTITVTPLAVGAATITVTAPATSLFNGTVSETFDVEFAQPEGETTAAPGEITTTFKNKDLEYDGAGVDWTASAGANSFETSGDARGVQFGAGIGEFTLTTTGSNVTKVSMVLSTNGTGNTIGVSVGNKAFTTTYGVEEDNDPITSLTLTSGMKKETIEFTGDAGNSVTISVNDANKSVYFKSITLTQVIAATFNASGYATFCSEYPLDFSATEDVTAWQVTEVSASNVIKFEKVTGSVKGGTGLLLVGEANATVEIPSADSDNELDDNLLVGTIAPTYIAAKSVYGLSGDQFKRNTNAGVIKANKAYLPAGLITLSEAPIRFEFVDGATGITEMKTIVMDDDAWYDLSGRRVAQPTKGLYIHNGKKVFIK